MYTLYFCQILYFGYYELLSIHLQQLIKIKICTWTLEHLSFETNRNRPRETLYDKVLLTAEHNMKLLASAEAMPQFCGEHTRSRARDKSRTVNLDFDRNNFNKVRTVSVDKSEKNDKQHRTSDKHRTFSVENRKVGARHMRSTSEKQVSYLS